MHAITFDTLEFTEQLMTAGVPDEQAKGHAKALLAAMKQTELRMDELNDRRDKQSDERMSGLATKQDLKELDVKIETKIKELEYRMTIPLGLMLVAVAGMLFTALRYFPPTQPIVISSHQMPPITQGMERVPATIQPAIPRPMP
ncbi:MAG: hypothetical protein HQM03_15760 [Magnetococcales bacterium]|nr:hypothetical protein [Magnetococcales bacterium]